MTFAREFLPKKLKDRVAHSVVQTEVSFISTRCDSNKQEKIKIFIFSKQGTVTNPTIRLVLSALRIFLSLTMSMVTGGDSVGEIVKLVRSCLLPMNIV